MCDLVESGPRVTRLPQNARGCTGRHGDQLARAGTPRQLTDGRYCAGGVSSYTPVPRTAASFAPSILATCLAVSGWGRACWGTGARVRTGTAQTSRTRGRRLSPPRPLHLQFPSEVGVQRHDALVAAPPVDEELVLTDQVAKVEDGDLGPSEARDGRQEQDEPLSVVGASQRDGEGIGGDRSGQCSGQVDRLKVGGRIMAGAADPDRPPVERGDAGPQGAAVFQGLVPAGTATARSSVVTLDGSACSSDRSNRCQRRTFMVPAQRPPARNHTR